MARIASHEPLIWEICDKTEEGCVIQEEFPSYVEEARDVQEVQHAGWIMRRKWCKQARLFGSPPACLLVSYFVLWRILLTSIGHWLYKHLTGNMILLTLGPSDKTQSFTDLHIVPSLFLTFCWCCVGGERGKTLTKAFLSVTCNFPQAAFAEGSSLCPSFHARGYTVTLKQLICLLPDTLCLPSSELLPVVPFPWS